MELLNHHDQEHPPQQEDGQQQQMQETPNGEKIFNQNVVEIEVDDSDGEFNDGDDDDDYDYGGEGFIFDFKKKSNKTNNNQNNEADKTVKSFVNQATTESDNQTRNHQEDGNNSNSNNTTTNYYHVSTDSLASDLRKAITNNNFDSVKHLYEIYGLDIDPNYVYSDNYWTPLMFAVSEANFKITQFLIEKGADPNYTDDSFSVLMCACGSRALMAYMPELVQVVDLLINSGADMNATDKYYQTPLIYASRAGNVELVEYLAKKGVDINAKDDYDWTSLAHASHKGHYKVVLKLLKLGADPLIHTSEYIYPHKLAYSAGFPNIGSLLKRFIKVGKIEKKYHSIINNQERTAAANDDDSDLSESEEEASTLENSNNTSNRSAGSQNDEELVKFLDALNLSHLHEIFAASNLTMKELLAKPDDKDLQNIGISDFNTRKLLVNELRKIHYKNWSSNGLIPLKLDQHLSCNEAVAILTNINRQIEYIESHIKFINNESFESSKSRLFHDEQMSLKLAETVEKCASSARKLDNELANFQKNLLMQDVCNNGDGRPIDQLKRSSSSSLSTQKNIWKFVMVPSLLIGLPYVICKYGKLSGRFLTTSNLTT